MSFVKGDIVFVLSPEAPSGKTRTIESLVKVLKARGFTPVAMKPVETSCPAEEDHDIGSRHGPALHRLMEGRVPLPVLVPYRFRAAGSGRDAARAAGLELSLGDLVQTMAEASRYGDIVVAETTGPALSPLAEDGHALDLAERVAGKLLVVSSDGADDAHAVGALRTEAEARGLTVVADPTV